MDWANVLANSVSTVALWLSWKAQHGVTKPTVFAELPVQNDESGLATLTLQNRGSKPAYEVDVSFSIGRSTYLKYVGEGGDEALPDLVMPDTFPIEKLHGGQTHPVPIPTGSSVQKS